MSPITFFLVFLAFLTFSLASPIPNEELQFEAEADVQIQPVLVPMLKNQRTGRYFPGGGFGYPGFGFPGISSSNSFATASAGSNSGFIGK